MAVSGSSNPISIWREISQDPSSGVNLVRHKLHISFPPYYLADLKNSVKSVLDSRLIRFEPELGGVLAGYGKIAILKSEAQTLFNLTDIHINVEGDFFVFCPQVGKELQGIVNRKSYGHVGCLVHGLFNVSLPKPYVVNSDDWIGKTAKLSDKVRFTVTKVDLQSQVPYIEGNIVEVISTNQQDDSNLPRERSCSDSGVSIASEEQLLVDDTTTVSSDDKMDKRRFKLSLTQRKIEASKTQNPRLGISSGINKSENQTCPSDSEESQSDVTSCHGMGESICLEMSDDTSNSCEKSSDDALADTAKSPKLLVEKAKKQIKSPSKRALKTTKPSLSNTSLDSDSDAVDSGSTNNRKNKHPTLQSFKTDPTKVSKNTTKRGKKVSQKDTTAFSGLTDDARISRSGSISDDESHPLSLIEKKKRKRTEDSFRDTPKNKKSKMDLQDEKGDSESVSTLVSNLFAAMSKKPSGSSRIVTPPESESSPRHKKSKQLSKISNKSNSLNTSVPAELTNELMKDLQLNKRSNSPIKEKGSDKNISYGEYKDDSPAKATASPKKNKIKIETNLNATALKIVDEYLGVNLTKERQQTPVIKAQNMKDDDIRIDASPSSRKKVKKREAKLNTPVNSLSTTAEATRMNELDTSRPTEESNSKLPYGLNSPRDFQDSLDSDEGVDVSETPVNKKTINFKTSAKNSDAAVNIKATESNAEKVSSPLQLSKRKSVNKANSTLGSATPKVAQTPTPSTKPSAKKTSTPSATHDLVSPQIKSRLKKEEDEDPESIIQELLQSSLMASPLSVTPKAKSIKTPSNPRNLSDAKQKTLSSTKKKAKEDDANVGKRPSTQVKVEKKLKVEESKNVHEKTIIKILQSVQPKQKSKLKPSKI